jgi:guanylate kinase
VKRGFPVVLAAPSGAGKTTIARALVEGDPQFVFSVSVTTRGPRAGEREGIDYRFLDRDAFEAMIRGGELCEWAEVHGQLYGTPLANLESAAERGEYAVLDIDVQGARQMKVSAPDAVLVFVLPPSVEILVERLGRRGTESPAEMARRLRTALDELGAVREFDHVVVNDDLERCLDEVQGIVRAEGRRTARAEALEMEVEEIRSRIAQVLREEYANASR